MVRFRVFRAGVAISFFALSTLSPSACLPFCACLGSLVACTEGDYFSMSEFRYRGKDLDLPKLLVLPINATECFPTLLKNMADKNGINI